MSFSSYSRCQLGSTYESAMTKKFYHGRTECMRSVTNEVADLMDVCRFFSVRFNHITDNFRSLECCHRTIEGVEGGDQSPRKSCTSTMLIWERQINISGFQGRTRSGSTLIWFEPTCQAASGQTSRVQHSGDFPRHCLGQITL